MQKIQKILGHFNAFLNNGYQRLSFLIPSFYRHEMDKLTSVLMSIEWWNKEGQPLVWCGFSICVMDLVNILGHYHAKTATVVLLR